VCKSMNMGSLDSGTGVPVWRKVGGKVFAILGMGRVGQAVPRTRLRNEDSLLRHFEGTCGNCRRCRLPRGSVGFASLAESPLHS
jgi:hypothetical protein